MHGVATRGMEGGGILKSEGVKYMMRQVDLTSGGWHTMQKTDNVS